MPSGPTDLFRRKFSRSGTLSEDELVPLDAAIMDVHASVVEIYQNLIPAIQGMDNNGEARSDRLLELLVELRTNFNHIEYHLKESMPILNQIIKVVSNEEGQ